mgnify:CR=1 FL=1
MDQDRNRVHTVPSRLLVARFVFSTMSLGILEKQNQRKLGISVGNLNEFGLVSIFFALFQT